MLPIDRIHQYYYFRGYAEGLNERQMKIARREFFSGYRKDLDPDDIFDHAPFNDNLKQIIRSFHIFKNSKSTNLTHKLSNLFREFFSLSSDFIIPDEGYGRTFYALTEDEQVVMQGDQFGVAYTLDGSVTGQKVDRIMVKNDFLELFPNVAPENWPYREALEIKS